MKSFLSNSLKLSSAPFITQIISFLVLPIITRAYDPDLFGVFNLLVSTAAFISVFCCMGFDQAVVLPEKEEDGISLFQLSFFFTLLIAFLTLAMLPLLETYIFSENIKLIKEYIYFIPLLVLISGLYNSFLAINIRMSNFGSIAFGRVINVIFNKSFIIFFSIFYISSVYSLLYGYIIGFVSIIIILVYSAKNINLFNVENNFINLIKEYKQFPIFIITNDFLFRGKKAFIAFLIVYLFSSEDAGQYAIALMILAIPTTLIGSSLSEVFYKKIANYKGSENNNEFKLLTLRLFKVTALFLFMFYVLIGFFSSSLLPHFLGVKWFRAGQFISILSILYFLDLIFAPCKSILKKCNKQYYISIYQLFVLIFSGLSFYIGQYYNDIFLALFSIAISNGFIIILYGFFTFKLIGINNQELIKLLLTFISYNIVPIILIFSINYFFLLSIPMILIISGTIYFSYVYILVRLDKDMRSILTDLLKSFKIKLN